MNGDNDLGIDIIEASKSDLFKEMRNQMMGSVIKSMLRINIFRILFDIKTLIAVVIINWIIYIGLGYWAFVKDSIFWLVVCIIIPIANSWLVLRK